MRYSFVFVAGFAVGASARAFLAHLPLNVTRNASDPEFKRALFAELEDVLGGELSSATRLRVEEIEEHLLPMFSAVPKNSYGKVDHAAVKYLLRRLFIKRQGWIVEGLEPASDLWDPDQNAPILEDKAPEIVREVVKRHIGEHGCGLHELAVVAAMMEHLIFEDTVGKLHQAFLAKRLRAEETVNRSQAQELVQLHLASFIRARDVSQWSSKQVASFQKLIFTLYPNWVNIEPLMIQVQDEVVPNAERLSFDDVANVVSKVTSLFAHWQNDMCETTTEHLVEIEEGRSGRVPLVDFYNAALHNGRYQFTETITYLRHLGTLDESDELMPKVIIPNYVSGRSNCVAKNSYYSVCCIDKCQGIFGHLENNLRKPFATPAEILSVVESEGSKRADVTKPHGDSKLSRRRLEEVAAYHDGLIPLHGRLFAQWMHLAYPHACPYPHISGTVYFNSMEQWEAETGEHTGSSIAEIQQWSTHLGELAKQRRESPDDRSEKDHLSGMWTMEEELVSVSRERAVSIKDPSPKMLERGLFCLALILSFMWAWFLQHNGSLRKVSSVNKRYVKKWCV